MTRSLSPPKSAGPEPAAPSPGASEAEIGVRLTEGALELTFRCRGCGSRQVVPVAAVSLAEGLRCDCGKERPIEPVDVIRLDVVLARLERRLDGRRRPIEI